jgi:hypothetical protein
MTAMIASHTRCFKSSKSIADESPYSVATAFGGWSVAIALASPFAAFVNHLPYNVGYSAWMVAEKSAELKLQAVNLLLDAINLLLDSVESRLKGREIVTVVTGLREDVPRNQLFAIDLAFQHPHAGLELFARYIGCHRPKVPVLRNKGRINWIASLFQTCPSGRNHRVPGQERSA